MRAARTSALAMSGGGGTRLDPPIGTSIDLRVVSGHREPGSDSPVILLVEDSSPDAELVRAMLARAAGYEVVHVTRLDAAVGIVAEKPPSCVLLDLTLPDADGLEGLRLIREAAQDVPIILLTGRQDERLGIQAVQSGAQDYLVKGKVDDDLLVRSIRYAVERKRIESHLVEAALHDALTGLPNRALLLDRIMHALNRSARDLSTVAVLFLDVNDFKLINDTLGHAAGDELLVAVAGRLLTCLRPGDTVARFGGDEFVMLLDGVRGNSGVMSVVERIRTELSDSFTVRDQEIFITASIGIAIAKDERDAPEELVDQADAAMYRSKERGRDRFDLFDPMIKTSQERRLETANALRRAIPSNQFRLAYQPQVRLADGYMVGVEALLRWRRDDGRFVLPADFIETAEDMGLMAEIGTWVVREACRQAALWKGARTEGFKVSINLSPAELIHPEIVQELRSALEDHMLDPGSLCVEITENIVADEGALLGSVAEIGALGVRLSIDDFGIGYSSLSALRRVPLDSLKIDRSFIAGVGVDQKDTAIVAAAVALGRALGAVSVAEGVETVVQARTLHDMGCDQAQGYHFGPPLAAEVVTEALHIGLGPDAAWQGWLNRAGSRGGESRDIDRS